MQYPSSIPFVVVFLLGEVALAITGGHYFLAISCSVEEAEVGTATKVFIVSLR